MYEATFRIDDGGPYATATAGTDARIELWCNDHCDLLHVTDGAAEEVIEHVEASVGVRDRLANENELVVVTAACLKDRTADHVERYLRAHGCLLLPPLRYAEGAKFCRLLALDPSALTACYRDLVADGYAVGVETKREVSAVAQDGPLLTLDDVLPALTSRQREVFAVAYERGYYRIPREVSTASIADAVGVERRTAEEHLRRAENKLVGALVPYL
ncbi:helix-turn-helix domain-containing protein [Halegenticoccus tardaugens]|uniref:helix-turn-helix domain-containing protein n=1 Tax=Halegenticoccus tardaugens TaxID=2071624 RepID=UPI00100AEAC5|nr:helix-turn-helix domain-containing protein [Halegenticoccus tardaugens]